MSFRKAKKYLSARNKFFQYNIRVTTKQCNPCNRKKKSLLRRLINLEKR